MYRSIPGVYLFGKYPTEVLGKVRHGPQYSTEHSVWFGTNSIRVPDTPVNSARFQYRHPNTWVCSVRPQYRYPTLRQGCYTVYRGYLPYRSGSVRPQYPTEQSGMVRDELDTCTRHLCKFGTTSIPVPDTSVCSVHPPKIPRV